MLDCLLSTVCCVWTLAHYAFYLLALVQLYRLFVADADLTLLFKSKFGSKPETLGGKVVWITGASSGIGEQLAYDLARYGCKLILSARRVPELERVKQKCLTSASIKEDDVKLLRLDLADFESHKEIAEHAVAAFGKVDVLVNNGGRTQRSLIADTPCAVDRDLFDVNTFGTMSITKALLPHFLQRKSGHLVVTSSVAGKLGAPLSATYSASKFALHGWFETLRIEHGEDGIGVTMVCPGPVFSNNLRFAFTGDQNKVLDQDMDPNDRTRMTTERCSELMVVAMANKLPEVWISKHPVLFFLYGMQYLPDIAKWFKICDGAGYIQQQK